MNPAINGAVKSRAGHHTVVAIVEDKPGVLMRVSSLFRRRGFNIESLTVGHSEAEATLQTHRRGEGHRPEPGGDGGARARHD